MEKKEDLKRGKRENEFEKKIGCRDIVNVKIELICLFIDMILLAYYLLYFYFILLFYKHEPYQMNK